MERNFGDTMSHTEICWLLFVVRHWKIECFKTWSKLLVANLRRNIKSSWFVVIHVISWFGWYQTITSTKSHSHLWWRFNLLFFSFILIRCDNNVCKLLLFYDGTSISVVIHCGKTYFLQFISNLQYFNADYLECFTTEITNVWQVCLINLG